MRAIAFVELYAFHIRTRAQGSILLQDIAATTQAQTTQLLQDYIQGQCSWQQVQQSCPQAQGLEDIHHKHSQCLAYEERTLSLGLQKALETLQASYFRVVDLLLTWHSLAARPSFSRDFAQAEQALLCFSQLSCLHRLQALQPAARMQAIPPSTAKAWLQQFLEKDFAGIFAGVQGPVSAAKQKRLGMHVVEYILQAPSLQAYFQEKDLYWSLHNPVVGNMLLATLRGFSQPPLAESLQPFVESLQDPHAAAFYTALTQGHAQGPYTASLQAQLKNWDLKRMYLVDYTLLQLALHELHTLRTPAGVLIDAYLTLAQHYSTPDSTSFVHGLLDRLCAEVHTH